MNLTPDKANIAAQLDMLATIRYIHRVGRDPDRFDLFFNLENMGLSDAAGILCTRRTA